MPRYLSCAVRLARDLGLNTEKGVAALSNRPAEREVFRGIWWSLLAFDSNISCGHNKPWEIRHIDSRIRLPTDPGSERPHPFDEISDIDIAVVSSDDWSVPALPGRGVMANLVLIQKIMQLTVEFSKQSLLGKLSGIERVRARTKIESSLRSWYGAAPLSIRQCHIRVRHSPRSNDSWRPFMILSLYHFSRINLWRSAFNEHILKSPSLAISSHAVLEAVNAAKEIANTIAKPVLEFSAAHLLGPFSNVTFFSAAAILMVALKLPMSITETSHNAASLDLLLKCMHSMTSIWQLGRQELNFLNHVATLNDAASVIRALETTEFPAKSEGLPTFFEVIRVRQHRGSAGTAPPASALNSESPNQSVASFYAGSSESAPSTCARQSQQPATRQPPPQSSQQQQQPHESGDQTHSRFPDSAAHMLDNSTPPMLPANLPSAALHEGSHLAALSAQGAMATGITSHSEDMAAPVAVSSSAPAAALSAAVAANMIFSSMLSGQSTANSTASHSPLITTAAPAHMPDFRASLSQSQLSSPSFHGLADMYHHVPGGALPAPTDSTSSWFGLLQHQGLIQQPPQHTHSQHAAAEPHGGPLLPGGRPGGVPGAMFSG
ncbi:hypothetical protein HK105_205155 [Polyrhizophydium stewartii]|uniref:Xylanolytic transcriptional activator regulatory domain-containing protein n=1 Tax=Polyrhizophydium stewartii TaxID=2732419 RepID=A0ABR4N759_9FUNG